LWHNAADDTASQAASGASNTDWYKLLHQIENFGAVGIFSIAFITQLLATFGIMVGINLLVWGMVVPLGGLIIELAVGILGFMAYNQFWSQYTASPSNAAAETFMAAMERELAFHTAAHMAGAFEVYLEYGNWLWAAYMNSDDATKCEWRKDKDFLMMLHLMPKDVEDWEGCDGDAEGEEKMEDDMEGDEEEGKLFTGVPTLFKLFKF